MEFIQLPSEIILQIATSSRCGTPAITRITRPTPSDKSLRAAIRAENLPIFYLSLTCKFLARLLTPELHRFVAINSAPRLYAFLRLLWARPQIADRVQQLYLHLPPTKDEVPCFGDEQMWFLQSWAKSMGILVSDALVKYPDSSDDSIDESLEEWSPILNQDEKCIAAATAMLINLLTRLRQVTLSLSDKTLSSLAGYLPHDLADSRQRAEHPQKPSDFLPKLESLALKVKLNTGPGSGVWFGNPSLLYLASLSTSLTELQVVDVCFQNVPRWHLHGNCGLEENFLNLNSLILQGVVISGPCLKELLGHFPNISSFTLQTGFQFDHLRSEAGKPRSVVHDLKGHYERLRKLCLELHAMYEDSCPEDECITTFKDFVNLEDLEIDGWSLDHTYYSIDGAAAYNSNETSDDDDQQTARVPAFRTLPPSLKRLCIKGCSTGIRQSMNWLMMSLRDSLPRLEEVELYGGLISMTSQSFKVVEYRGIKFKHYMLGTA